MIRALIRMQRRRGAALLALARAHGADCRPMSAREVGACLREARARYARAGALVRLARERGVAFA